MKGKGTIAIDKTPQHKHPKLVATTLCHEAENFLHNK